MTGTLSLARSPDRWVTVMDGARLRQLRRQRGLSAAELATKAGIGLSTEIQLERQPQHSCRTRTLARLAAALGQPPTDLIADRLPGLRSRDSAMKWQTEMQLRSSGLLDDRRFDALANALAELDEADPEVEDTDLTASLADGGVLVAMVVTADNPADAIRRTVATARAAIQPIGDFAHGWEQITGLASLTVRPANSARFTYKGQHVPAQLPSGKPPRWETIG